MIDPNQVADRAEQLFIEGFACSQAVLIACAPHLGLDENVAARVASTFGGGMARRGLTCGAVTGALMVIGLQAGNATAADVDRKEDAYARVNTLVDAFRAEHRATDCRELIGYRIGDPAQRQAAADAGVFRSICPRLVRTSATLAARAILPTTGPR